MPHEESTLSKICNATRGAVPFCLDLDDNDSYIISEPKKSSNNK